MASFRSSVFIPMYGSIQGFWSNRRARWTLVGRMPRDMYSSDSDSKAHSGPCCFNLCRRQPNAEEGVLILRHPLFLNHHALRCHRICIVRVMKLFWVLLVHLEYKALWIACWMNINGFDQLLAVFFPPEGARW